MGDLNLLTQLSTCFVLFCDWRIGTHQFSLHTLYYVSGNVLEPIGRDYLYSELVNPIFIKDGDNVKVKVAVKFIDNQTKATQVSQYELVLHKDSNWKIVG